jgi:hypothetical protein
MYNPLRTIRNAWRGYNTRRGMTLFGCSGAIVGGLVGVALPAYIGWELTDYIVDNAVKFGPVLNFATNVIGAVGLTAMVVGKTVPAGIAIGVGTGFGIGAFTSIVKESLEKLVSRK